MLEAEEASIVHEMGDCLRLAIKVLDIRPAQLLGASIGSSILSSHILLERLMAFRQIDPGGLCKAYEGKVGIEVRAQWCSELRCAPFYCLSPIDCIFDFIFRE